MGPRVVALANFYGPTSGGLRTTLDELGRGFRRRGIERILIVPGPRSVVAEDDTGVRYEVAARWQLGGYRIITDRGAVVDLLEWLAPDSIEVSDKLTLAWAGRWAARRGVPAVLLSHERIDAILASRVPPGFPLRRTADVWNRRLLGGYDEVVCASGFAREEFDRIGAAPSRVVPLGVDLETFRPAGTPGRRTGPLEVLCVGRLSREKAPELALQALAPLARVGLDARLTFAGDGPLRSQLERAASGQAVAFTGHVSNRSRVAELMGAADVVLAPCPAETFGLAVLEALACGTPVVTAGRGAARELVGGDCGRAAAPGPEGMAAAVAALLAVPEARRRRAARTRAEQFPWDRTVEGILAAHRRAGADLATAGARAA